MNHSNLIHPSSRPAGHGITIGTPRLYDLSAALLFGGRRRAYGTLLAAGHIQRGDRVLEVGWAPATSRGCSPRRSVQTAPSSASTRLQR
jgi:hypothetical protein